MDFVLGEYTLTAKEFDKFCIGKEFNGEEMTPPNGQSTYAVEVPNDMNLKEMISVWINGPFWNWWKWEYGTYWNVYPGKHTGRNSVEVVLAKHGPCWHQVYGSFKINYWHVEQRWHVGTLPWNYVKYWIPNPTYENLHYQGQK